MSKKASTTSASVTKPKSKLGTFEENWLENSLKRSYEISGDAALGVNSNRVTPVPEIADGTPETGVLGASINPSASALDIFGGPLPYSQVVGWCRARGV